LILSSTVALTVIGGSRPRGSGTHEGALAGAGEVVGFLMATETPLPLVETGEATGTGGAIEVTPAQVDGRGGEAEIKRSVSFSARKMLLKFMI